MIEYICHTRYDGKDCNKGHVLIRRGDRLERKGDMLFYKDKAICIWRSLVSKQHFAINADGLGMERGKITRRLAYDPRGDGSQRFTDNEQKLLREKYSHLLKPLDDVILFNDAFFELTPAELMQLEQELNTIQEVD